MTNLARILEHNVTNGLGYDRTEGLEYIQEISTPFLHLWLGAMDPDTTAQVTHHILSSIMEMRTDPEVRDRSYLQGLVSQYGIPSYGGARSDRPSRD